MRCPEGHVCIRKTNQTGPVQSRGAGLFRCTTCGEAYDSVLDAKLGTLVTLID